MRVRASARIEPDASRALERRREAAEKYRPDEIDLLIVAEAPPDEPDRYFYFEDVRKHDDLFRYVCLGILGQKLGRNRKCQGLAELRDRGVFMIDLQEETPRDTTPLDTFVPALIERCHALLPRRIILVKVTVFDSAYDSLRQAGLPVSAERIPFPNSGRQGEFEAKFGRALSESERPLRSGSPGAR